MLGHLMRLAALHFHRSQVFYLLMAAGLIVLDRVTKAAVSGAMPLHSTKELIPGFFNLVHTRNTGIAFSLFADSGPWVRNVVLPAVSVAAVLLIVYLFLSAGGGARRMNVALTLVLAGAAGNLYDRAIYGYVVDFLDVYVVSYHWPAFNVADSCITIGAGLLLIDALRAAGQERREPESA